jgi:DNA replication protein DnaC
MESARDSADYPRYLLRLCELERIDRERRNVERRIRLARFTQIKSLDTFDFAAQPSLNKPLVLELARCEDREAAELHRARAVRHRQDPHRPGPGACRLPEGP